ncbi:hypothetical protein CGC58_11050 [Capnocytophaga stomatis]|uniref:Pentapeptide repeat-containing protein n=1 Tax=Capnocytophaga stomatis TaxID=1848904 RepID=A0A250FYS5_9FLAO|nr:pentapeptide repeat-containing protein [Capnocytophaga stomatis]ATA90213.1 hypothetical protein CGC58_11050 [Capnocytophaga stomatis]
MNDDLEKYIQKIEKNPETGEDEVWLHNLPKDESLFTIINKFRKKYEENKFIITKEIYIQGKTINKEVNFSSCVFIQDVNFLATQFKQEVNFLKTRFKKEANFSDVEFESIVDFSESKFLSEVIFQNTKFLWWTYFSETIFFSKANFLGAQFLSITKFSDVQFEKNTYFHYVTFKDIIDFSGKTYFKDAICFDSIDFQNKVLFSNVIFEQETQFLHCKIGSNTFISFEGATFKKCLDISRSNFHHCNLRFWNIKIEGDENLSQYEKYINDFGDKKVEPSVYAKIRETYRTIKNAFYKEDNRIEGLEFYKKEMDVYEKELKEKSFWHKDRFMLLLNKISNNYGTSWSRGLLFTITVAFIFYLCILISLHNSLEWDIRSLDAWDNFLKHFLEVINVTRWKDIEPFGVELNGLAYLFLFIGRIFIGYGYYQTIQAFRKYGKSS